jgi:ABC-type uncharacterized transport system auxiliary subunit
MNMANRTRPIATKIVMKAALMAAAASALVLASCATVNRLDWYDLRGSRLAAVMRTPPEPRLNVDYDVLLDSRNPVYSALSVLTNLAKANQAHHAEAVMRRALDQADVPVLIRDRAFDSCADTLDARAVQSRADADYVLELDIHDWGIDARTAWDPVSMRIRVSASLYRAFTDELVWRRDVTVSQAASPEMFGLGSIVGNMVTTQVLSELTEDELATGFRGLAVEAARKVARSLEKDLDAVRYR